ncbi:hypothetical protein SDC9_32342 [bioreactor metagenome]|uniref:Uncharacterized protein n=1 Tax=bioreactor metagenome TaxID=1076179 RepID=A0A644V6D3_9ZZZZ|nr:hypothetical protein [Macellibacteroides fermentans]
MDYRNLSASEKIEQVRKYRPYKEERRYMAVYLTALRRNDRKTIDEYESFGDDPRHIIMNRRAYDRGQLFGFTVKTLNEHGWLKNAEFTNVERIEFIDRKGWVAFNYVTIGQGANGKWSYGASYSTGGSGGGYGLGIWGEVYNNRKECLTAALRELLSRHARQRERLKNDPTNFNPTLSNTVVKQVQAMLQEMTVAKQLTLLFK